MRKIVLSIVGIIILVVVGLGIHEMGGFSDCWVPGDPLIYKIIDSPQNSTTCREKVKNFIAQNKNPILCDQIVVHYWPGQDPEQDRARKMCRDSVGTTMN